MPVIEMPEMACLLGYLLLSAWTHTPECDIIIAYFVVIKSLLKLREKARVGIGSWVALQRTRRGCFKLERAAVSTKT